jgi:hypothetical protein
MAAVARHEKSKLPPVVPLLALGTFLMGHRCRLADRGQSLDTALGETGPATVGVVMVVLGLVPLIALAAKCVNRAEAARTDHFDHGAARAVRA